MKETSTIVAGGGERWVHSKIAGRHLERLAVVYVRQSTPQQLVKHQESTRLQYGLTGRATALGWPHERVLVIDDDLGRSGATAEGRPGFQRLVAEVGLDHVGIILGVEMSRLARSCRDWHQLLEVCAVFGTLIGDTDGIYDPSDYNDRLLLGLKGTMSEAELHVLKQRMLQGKLAKARRGELGMLLPIGFARRPSGEVIQDPDEQARSVISLIFECFASSGTVNAVLRYLVQHGIRFPLRARSGVTKGDLEWVRPNRQTLMNILHHPAYAGAYAYGRRPTDARRKQPGRPGTGRTVKRWGTWEVLLKDRWPAYITWEQYEANVRQMAANRQQAIGIARSGEGLVAGMLRCGRCGRRMSVCYSGGRVRYVCSRDMVDYAGPLCCSLAGRVLDEHVAEMVLAALKPSSLEVSMQVAAEIEQERDRLEANWQQRRERAEYEVQRATRQYNAVEPENRLVARTVEHVLEEKLVAQKALDEEYHRFVAQQPTPLTAEERRAIEALAADIPSLWCAATTTVVDRKSIVRQLIEEVLVAIVGESERVAVEIRWAGGRTTKSSLVRPVARFEQLSYYRPLLDRILRLRDDGLTSDQIAEQLNAEGWRPPKRRPTFHGAMVVSILSRSGLTRAQQRRQAERRQGLAGEWRLPDLAKELAMPTITLYSWLRRGWVQGRQLADDPQRPWVIAADTAELARLRAFRDAPKRGQRWGKALGVA
jgi:DNA invertase Pin-like site-specific DNA recombinase